MQQKYDLLGQVIKEARIAAGLTREQLGSKINKSPRYIASIENEHKRPSYKSLCEIIVAPEYRLKFNILPKFVMQTNFRKGTNISNA